MNDYCPDCGEKLLEPYDLKEFWLRLLKCPRCIGGDFIEVADARWIYPMLRLELGVSEAIQNADDNLLRSAIQRIRTIDYKTVSIVDFEHTLLGCYDSKRTYRIVYPDGSEK